ncbi:hypothetical protein DD238_007588 [Peronospora effusa]|uniref:EGF-like domain-containing protein n=1 Tax=Peronospora effusa TaxID=542832 RepID=A0A3M6VFH8_9STRA|nr:hypothetical protein DD238_007588 [Peronospora effusa]
MISNPSALLALILVLSAMTLNVTQATYEAFAASSSSECCSKCIGKTSDIAYSYDPLIFEQCTSVTGGICCFDCGNSGDPIYEDTVTYGDDGVTAVVKSGTYISFTWSGVESVTYVSLKTGQKKMVTPTVSDAAATKKSDTFLICAKSAGTIYFRGWGNDTCRKASPEHSITIEAGDSSSTTCDANDVKVTTSSSSNDTSSGSSSVAADATVKNCNQQRASIVTVDGMETCVCVSDWTNPPECDRWPLWKWLVTIGGGVAALFSSIISLRALLAGRKKKQEEYRESVDQITPQSDVATLKVTPDSNYHVNGVPLSNMHQQSLAQILTIYLINVTFDFHGTLAKTEAFAASSSSKCCSTCIGKTSDVATSGDPLIVSQCTNVTGDNCCFDCGNLSELTYGNTVSYGEDGVTAVAKTGTYISFTWSGVESVTYVSVETGQTKTLSPTVSNSVATKESNTFMICAKSAGIIYFRGWGSSTCKEASSKHSITIEAGGSSTTCDAYSVSTLSSSGGNSVTAGETVEGCNQERATLVSVNGIETCVCASGWTNPPECDHWPFWKWLLTIGGAVAALVIVISILFSVRAFVQKRKKKKEEEENYHMNLAPKKHEDEGYRENLAPMGTKSDLGPLDYTPESGYHDGSTMMTPTKEAERTPGGTRKLDERLFSL